MTSRPRLTQKQLLRFWSRSMERNEQGCYLWTGRMSWNGYGHFYAWGRMQVAHRVIWIHERGPIPEGMQLDHTCQNRNCVNPDHLEIVTPKENTRRAMQNRLGRRPDGRYYTKEEK